MSTLEEDILNLLRLESGLDEGHSTYYEIKRLFTMARLNAKNGLYTIEEWYEYYFGSICNFKKGVVE